MSYPWPRDEEVKRIKELEAEVEHTQANLISLDEAYGELLRKVEGLQTKLTQAREIREQQTATVEKLRFDKERFEAANNALDKEVERLRSGQWTDEERKLFLFEATKASYAEGTRAGCEELSIHAADMDVELERLRVDVEEEAARASDNYKAYEREKAEVEGLRAELDEAKAPRLYDTEGQAEVDKLRAALKTMRENVRANVFDGQEGGVVTMEVSLLLDEIDECARVALAEEEGC